MSEGMTEVSRGKSKKGGGMKLARTEADYQQASLSPPFGAGGRLQAVPGSVQVDLLSR